MGNSQTDTIDSAPVELLEGEGLAVRTKLSEFPCVECHGIEVHEGGRDMARSTRKGRRFRANAARLLSI